MKKLLLSCMMLLGLGGVTYGTTIKVVKGFGDAITSLAGITDGSDFVISNGTNVLFFAQNQNSENCALSKVKDDAYFTYYLEKVSDSGKEGDNIYRVFIKNLEGVAYPKGINGGSCLNTPNSGWSISFAGDSEESGKSHKYGTDADFLGLWYVTYDAEKGFSFQNVGKATNGEGWPSWLAVDGLKGDQQYIKLYKEIEFEDQIVPDIEIGSYDATDANTALFAGFGPLVAEGATYDVDTKEFNGKCGWQWAGGQDFGAYQYIVITVGKNVTGGGYKVHIKDASGVEVSGDEYGADFMNMWIGAWNNHNCLKIDLEKLRTEKYFDIHHITDLWIEAGEVLILGNAYATNQVPGNNKSWNNEEDGDFKVAKAGGSFGTICLNFPASVAGAYVYEIAGKGDGYVSLSQYNGILEAGKPYIFKANDNESGNVYFYKATAAEVDDPIENNGLIGTFSYISAVDNDMVVLSGNELWTVDSEVSIPANKAYIDLSKIAGDASRGTVFLGFGDATGIEGVKSIESKGEIFNLNGQRLAQPTKGLNIIGGKKVMVK